MHERKVVVLLRIRRVHIDREMESAVTCFGRAAARTWPATAAQAVDWIRPEVLDKQCTFLGAFDRKTITGVIAGVPLFRIFGHFDRHEQDAICDGLIGTEPYPTNLLDAYHIGALGVEEAFCGRGIATDLFRSIEKIAVRFRYKTLVGHTARPSENYPTVGSLELCLNKWQMHELPTGQTLYYSSPTDLEKVWVYKEIA
jgi:GNAT superfamily N-acetyltransferase